MTTEPEDIEYTPITFCPKCKQAIIPEEIMEQAEKELKHKREQNKLAQAKHRKKKKEMMKE